MAAKTPAQWKTLFENVPFHRENYYTGPLGPDYTPGGTCLRLWAPTAEAVTVTLYHKGDGGAVLGTKPLVRGAQGVWSVWLPGEQHGRYYTFAVTVDGVTRETGDPYARAAGVNGVRSMIVDLARTAPSGWERDVRPNIPPAQRAVWEVSVRDFSQDAASGVRPAWRGKYMAFTQRGTTLHGDGIHPTCLNYLKRLGVKYVQLMPIFDFGSVDEAKPLLRQYNWGYDPTNFNVPEGSYSTDPTRGEVRIRECREMIAALHAAGIGVVMDVVYNHTYRTENPLNNTVPYYFFRQNADGSFSNGSGCGNEFASERPMARRYLIDSILYWAKEYHIDGFRFDLMGLYDAESINAVRAALDSLPGGRDILLYGEPWQGGASQLHRYEANKANLAMLNERVGIFCDDTRDAIKGGCFDAREPGYVEGKPGSFWDIGAAVAALNSRVLAAKLPGVVETVPAFASLLITYDPLVTEYDTIADAVKKLADADGADAAAGEGRLVTIPVCYGGDFGPDLPFVAQHAGLTEEEVIALHAGREYQIYMLGFLPGFPYLGGLDERLFTPRLGTPRTAIPAGAVGIGGEQTGIYPIASPGGWQLIGRTPLKLFDPASGTLPYAAGDRIRFTPITAAEFAALAAKEGTV